MNPPGSTLERTYREDYGRIVATVIRVLGGDFAAAEEVVQEAFADALAQWPRQGIPHEPRAWVIRAAPELAGQTVLVNLSGRGDKDVAQALDILGHGPR